MFAEKDVRGFGGRCTCFLDYLNRNEKVRHIDDETIRSLIMNGTVRERISKEHLAVICQLIGESTNLNQLARQANTYGFFAVAEKCEDVAKEVTQLINRLKDDR